MAEKPWSNMTFIEKAKYKSVIRDTLEACNETIAHYRKRLKDPNITPKEESYIGKQLPKVVYNRAKIEAKDMAKTSPGVLITPPTKKQVEQAEKMADATNDLQNDLNGLKSGLAIAKAALGLVSAIQKKPA